MKKKNLILIIIAILIVTIAIVFIFLNIRATNDESVAITESMIESQKELEAEFIAEGYTIDEPNVIVNPYGNSPLTALIMFETEDNVSVKITIEGKMSIQHLRIRLLNLKNIIYQYMDYMPERQMKSS